MKVYISGKISGEPMHSVIRKFDYAASMLRDNGFKEIVNPLLLDHSQNVNKDWAEYMRVDIQALMDCQTIAVLPCYKDSQGAKLEINLAVSLGFNIIWLDSEVLESRKIQ